MMTKRISLAAIVALLAAAACAVCALAQAEAYPNKAIRWVIPFQPGGGTDMVARPVAAKLTERIGKPVVVENNTAGAGVTGTLAVSRSTPDGHNLVILTGGTPSQQLLRPDQPYNLLKDFAMVTTICASFCFTSS